MMGENHCRQIRLRWMELFDQGEPSPRLPSALAEHLDRCPACREFTTAAAAARSHLFAVPLPAPDVEADRALLEALSRPAPASGGQTRLAAIFASFRLPGLRPMLVAGAASFVITLAAGVALSVAPVRAPIATATSVSEPAPTRRAERDFEARLDEWIAAPGARLRPQPPLQRSRQRSQPARPRERSDRSLRSHAV